MKNAGGPVYRHTGAAGNMKSGSDAMRNNSELCKKRPGRQYLAACFVFVTGALFVFVIFLLQLFVQQAFAATVQCRPFPVFAQGFGNKILVGVKVQYNNYPAERL